MLCPLILHNNNLSRERDRRKSHVLLINFGNDCDQWRAIVIAISNKLCVWLLAGLQCVCHG